MTISIGLQRKPLLMFGRIYYDRPIYYLHIDKSNIPIEWSDVRGIPCSHMRACIFYLPDSRLSQCISDVPTIGGKSNGEIE